MEALDLLSITSAPNEAAAVTLTDGDTLTYGELRSTVSECTEALRMRGKALVVIDQPRGRSGLIGYLAAMAAGHAVVLVEGGDATLWAELITAYEPELLVTDMNGPLAYLPERTGYLRHTVRPLTVWRKSLERPSSPIHRELAMLIRTSGSLGAPKTVRLSYANLHTNAVAIAEALSLRASDRALTSLPLDFSFGLSIVNSAFAAGASVALAAWSPSSTMFWRYSDHVGGTCVGAVPATFRFLRDCGWDPAAHPHLRLLLHAGGALDSETIGRYATRMATKGGEFVSMYGQTEATARITCLRGSLGTNYNGSVGTPVPGTQVTIHRLDGTQADEGETGEIVVRGPGVMMGYAVGRADLAFGDRQGTTLLTGDLGHIRDGFLYLTGRRDRQVKVFGHKVNLDQLEAILESGGIPGAVELLCQDRIVVITELTKKSVGVCRDLAEEAGLPSSSVSALTVSRLPRTRNGKLDRQALAHITRSLP